MTVFGIIALAAALAALTGIGAALGMSHATAHAVDSIARQPEAPGKISSPLMFGLIMMETCAIYGLFAALMIILVLPGNVVG